ncbi:hypothetical protein [Mesomycoplasma neurolyticum]|uniref:Uncharacterized protein n=1 Tax=Mesomycoplasma neurolyticum TaxID=2120 RepID=A0A449A579_9BACT|nr:hypothetical protein [Mesomycoplasma neurolyticum]VEU59421.1 Uncharacterised protein [Mesomycoplasma neurolyticum]
MIKKNWKKFVLLTFFALPIPLALMSYLFYSGYSPILYKNKVELNKTENIKRKDYVNFKSELTNKQTNITDDVNEADINIFSTPWGVQPFLNMLRLSMINEKQNYLFYYPKSNELQKRLISEKLEYFLNNEREINENTNKSYVENVDVLDHSIFYEKATKIINENKEKKINIWLNAAGMQNFSYFLQLLDFPNVQFRIIEDSQIYSKFLLSKFKEYEVKYKYFNEKTKKWEKPTFYDPRTIFLISNYYNKIKFFWSDSESLKEFKKINMNNHFHFFNDMKTEIKDLMFDKRAKDKKRLFLKFNEIMNFSWENERDKVLKNQSINNKKNLIILGTKNDFDKDIIKHVVKKYGSEYNIYYKGHPGSNHNAEWLELFFNQNQKKEIVINNLDTMENENLTLTDDIIVNSLETQIPSELLTTENATKENGLYFDKWVLADDTTNAALGINNNLNSITDIIEIWKIDKMKIYNYETQTQEKEYTNFVFDLAKKILPKVLNVSLKNKNNNYNQNDFDFQLAENKIFSKIEKIELISNDKNSYKFLISLILNTDKEITIKPIEFEYVIN